MAYQFLRGNSAENNAYIGPSGSFTVDFENSTLRVHDGTTAGGAFSVALNQLSAAYGPSQVTLGDDLAGDTILSSATATQAGVMTSSDKTKLNSVGSGAEANTVDSVAGKTGGVLLNKNDVGLDSLENYAVASRGVAEAGSSNSVYMTPLRSSQNAASVTGIENEAGYTRKRGEEVYHFFAYRSSNYSSGTGDIVFNASRADSRGYSTATGEFTAPADGVYYFNAQILRQGGVSSNGVNIGLSKNGATSGTGLTKTFAEKSGTSSDNGIIIANVTTVMFLAKNDTMSVRAFNSIPVSGGTSEIYSFFQGYLI